MAELELDARQVRNFRLQAHHLDAFYGRDDALAAVGACGMQNSPPGAWEAALFNRVPACGAADRDRMPPGGAGRFCRRGASAARPWCSRRPTAPRSCRRSQRKATAEPWIYTRGIGLALDFLGVGFDELLALLEQVMPRLDGRAVVGKAALDQTLAAWMEPLLPARKRSSVERAVDVRQPRQADGGRRGAGLFLLRPCSFKGLVVFGAREGTSPAFSSASAPGSAVPWSLIRRRLASWCGVSLHRYGPTAPGVGWPRGWDAPGAQARRLWRAASDEMEPVRFLGKKAYVLSAPDRERTPMASEPPQRELLLLAAHDPYLDQRDRAVLQPDKALQRRIWRTVANPGAIVRRGEVAGTWTAKKKGAGLEVRADWWDNAVGEQQVRALAEQYAAFRGLELAGSRKGLTPTGAPCEARPCRGAACRLPSCRLVQSAKYRWRDGTGRRWAGQ